MSRARITPIIPEHAGALPAALAHIQPGSLRAWILAARPATLTAAVVPVCVGSSAAYAAHAWKPPRAVAALLGALLLQLGANFANDVFDFERGADTSERLGPTRAVHAGLLRAEEVRAALYGVFGLAVLVGGYLALAAGPWIVLIGILSIVCALAYTAGPYPLGYHGLGDVLVMIFFGFVGVCATAFVQAGFVPILAWWGAIPVGSLATAMLVVNNLRDRDTDRRAGKRTLAVLLGPRAAIAEYAGLMTVAYLVPLLIVARGLSQRWALLPFLSAPMAVYWTVRAASGKGAILNRVLRGTARLLLVFGILFAAGLALGARW